MGVKPFDISLLKAPPTAVTAAQAVDYIHEILTELIPMANTEGLPPALGHLLEMARLEADNLVKHFAIAKRTPRPFAPGSSPDCRDS
jgi:hypothetical protein